MAAFFVLFYLGCAIQQPTVVALLLLHIGYKSFSCIVCWVEL